MTLAYFEVLFEAGRVTPAARRFVLELTPRQRFALCVERPEEFAATVRELAKLSFTLGDLERLAGSSQGERWGRAGPVGAAWPKTRPSPEGEQAVWPERCHSDQDARKVPFCSRRAAVGPRRQV